MKKKLFSRQKKKESSSSNSSSDDDSSQESSEQRVAVKEMQFRKRRGEKIKYLMERNKKYENEEEENFWKTNKYFANQVGDNSNQEEEDTSYREEGNEKMDSYDSDFGKDDEDNKEDDKNESEYVEGRKGQKRQVTLRVQRYQIQKKIKKNKSSPKKIEKSGEEYNDISSSEHQQQKEQKKKFIHDYFSQEQLIKEAIQTELKNKESLEKLMRLEEEKKNYFLTGTRQMNEARLTTKIQLKENENNENKKEVDVCLILKDFDQLSEDERIKNMPLSYLNMKKESVNKGKKYKYRHPKTLQGYNSIEEYQHLNKVYVEKQKQQINKQVSQLEKLLV